MYREGGSPDRWVVSLREVLANLACKLHHLMEYVWAWLLSWSCGHVVAWCDVVLLCQPWRYMHGGDLLAILCDVVLAMVFVIISMFPGASYRS